MSFKNKTNLFRQRVIIQVRSTPFNQRTTLGGFARAIYLMLRLRLHGDTPLVFSRFRVYSVFFELTVLMKFIVKSFNRDT